MLAPLQVIPLAAQPTLPWRNGGGQTREVAAEPQGARAGDPFAWRLSVATVAADGPFSAFPGVDRSLWLLSGAGLRLDVGGHEVTLDRVGMRFDFPGEAQVGARLLGGPTQDLNLMCARGRVRACAELVALHGGETWQRATALSGTDVVLCTAGSIEVGDHLLHAGDAVRLDATHARRWVLGAPLAARFLFATLAQQ